MKAPRRTNWWGRTDAQEIEQQMLHEAVHRAIGNVNESCQWLWTVEMSDEKDLRESHGLVNPATRAFAFELSRGK